MSQLRSVDLTVPVPRTGDSVVEGVLAPPAASITVGARRRLRAWFLPVEVLAVSAAGLVAAWVHATSVPFAFVVIAMTVATLYHSGLETVRPGLPHAGRILKDLGLPVVVVAAVVAMGAADVARLADALLIVGAVAAVAVAATLARRALEGQVRLIIVGSQDSIAKASTRWAGDRRAKVVGALLVGEPSTSVGMDESFGVRTISDMGEVADWVDRWAADMAVVVPGGGVTSEQVRRLSWDLERTRASIAVMGVLDHVAPHRIDTTRFADATLLHIRASRPSLFVRCVKLAASWMLGLALLVVTAPLMLTMMALVRLDSKGPAIFKQTRVGRDGRLFTMYKMRTMVQDAEATLEALRDQDDGNGVLFKLHRDPRVTRVGWFLRRSSLDELPQLLNVVRGDMSLIGPRPALPVEVALYDEVARRRLAVRPGLTGLWQVSGRSTLSWERSIQLDLDYTDNWRLTDDLLIGVRTVDAVARRKGAY